MKSLFATRTFWFNAISAALLIIALPEFTAVVPPTWIKYLVLLQAIGNILLRYITTQPVKAIGKPSTGISSFLLIALLSFAGSAASCPNRERIPVMVGQTGVAVSQSIGEISGAARKLEQAAILPTAAALNLQEGLLAVNTALKPLPDILRTIDAAQKAGNLQEGDVNKAIAILQAVAPQISTLLAGVPINESTKVLINLVRAAQETTTTVLLEIAKLRQP